jgi:hypothetical protein
MNSEVVRAAWFDSFLASKSAIPAKARLQATLDMYPVVADNKLHGQHRPIWGGFSAVLDYYGIRIFRLSLLFSSQNSTDLNIGINGGYNIADRPA